jgi:hypothetical protein
VLGLVRRRRRQSTVACLLQDTMFRTRKVGNAQRQACRRTCHGTVSTIMKSAASRSAITARRATASLTDPDTDLERGRKNCDGRWWSARNVPGRWCARWWGESLVLLCRVVLRWLLVWLRMRHWRTLALQRIVRLLRLKVHMNWRLSLGLRHNVDRRLRLVVEVMMVLQVLRVDVGLLVLMVLLLLELMVLAIEFILQCRDLLSEHGEVLRSVRRRQCWPGGGRARWQGRRVRALRVRIGRGVLAGRIWSTRRYVRDGSVLRT